MLWSKKNLKKCMENIFLWINKYIIFFFGINLIKFVNALLIIINKSFYVRIFEFKNY